jgi:hypothetical protein
MPKYILLHVHSFFVGDFDTYRTGSVGITVRLSAKYFLYIFSSNYLLLFRCLSYTAYCSGIHITWCDPVISAVSNWLPACDGDDLPYSVY